MTFTRTCIAFNLLVAKYRRPKGTNPVQRKELFNVVCFEVNLVCFIPTNKYGEKGASSEFSDASLLIDSTKVLHDAI